MASRISSKKLFPVFLTLTISLFFIVIASLATISLYKNINLLEHKWEVFQTQTVLKQQFIKEFKDTFNDKGLLSDIKNYVQSPNEIDVSFIQAQLKINKKNVDDYQHINDLSITEVQSLLTIEHELINIKNYLSLIKELNSQNKPRQNLAINNQSVGQAAVAKLVSFNIAEFKAQNLEFKEVIQQMLWLIIAVFSLVPLILFYVINYWLARHKVSSDILNAANRDELDKIFKFTAIPTLIVNRSGDIVNANSNACDLTGYSMNHLLSKHLEQLIVEEPMGFIKQIMTLNKHKNPKKITSLLTNQENKIRVEIEIIQIKEGANLLSVISLIDIENQQLLLERYSAQEQMYEFTEAVNHVGSWRWDFSSDKLSWSPKTVELYGFEEKDSDITQELILSFIPSDEREDVSNAINEAVIFGNKLDIKHHIQQKNGELVFVKQHGHVVNDEDGKARYMLGTISLVEGANDDDVNIDEISDRVFNLSLDAMAVTDQHNTILKVNNAFLTTTGFTSDETVGQELSTINRATYFDPSIYDKINVQISKSDCWAGELWNVKKNGDVYPTAQHICALSHDNNQTSRYLCTFRDISEQKKIEERIINSRAIDSITMLPSRSVLQDRLSQSIKRHERDGYQSAVLIISLEPLFADSQQKEYIQAIKTLSQRLIQFTRDHDSIARFGCYEFAVLLEGLGLPEDAYVVADKIHMTLSQPLEINNAVLKPTVSIGISLHPIHATNDETLIQYADAAMQQAKLSNVDKIQTFNHNILKSYNDEQYLNTQLQRAIDLKELTVNYQPVISFDTQQIVRCIAHARWHHRAYNTQDTENFITSAKHGLLNKPLHDWLLENAIKYATQWNNKGLSAIELQIKVVKSQLIESGLTQMIKDILNTYQFAPQQLVLEMTNEDLNLPFLHIEQELNNLADIGIKVLVTDAPDPTDIVNLNVKQTLINTYSIADPQLASSLLLAGEEVINQLKEIDVYPPNFDWNEKTSINYFENIKTRQQQKLLVCGSVDSQNLILVGQKLLDPMI